MLIVETIILCILIVECYALVSVRRDHISLGIRERISAMFLQLGFESDKEADGGTHR